MKTYHPKVEVSLIKVVDRAEAAPGLLSASRYESFRPGAKIDLTPYLGEHGGVRVSKGVKEPAGGFTVTLADKFLPEHFETLYAMIEPMDIIEIRMAHNPADYAKPDIGYRPPIMMRGFVSDVSRQESMGGDGRPLRRVVVSGQDYGKLLQIFKILYINNSVVGDNLISGFELLQKYGADISKGPSIAEFVEIVIDKIITPGFLDALFWWEKPTARSLSRIIPDVTVEGRVSPAFASLNNVSLYDMLAQASDVSMGINEMFVRDDEDAVRLVIRPTPWHDLHGEPIQRGVAKRSPIVIDHEDLVALNCARSDGGVANVFWVRNYRYPLVDDTTLRLVSQVAPISDYQNCDPRLYGIRVMDVTSNVGPPEFAPGDAPSEASAKKYGMVAEEWLRDRRDVLVRASRDAVVFERGTMTLRGNEKIKAGEFIELKRRDFSACYYVAQVEHQFVPFSGYTTTVTFERGEGFAKRQQVDEAPYLSEMDARGVL